ncbi:ABC transporter substrate-binding protein [[Clostridium] scindens]|uniref:ABC transporter substrate-binding protein n=1 Tax=Clostridium scindens (strain JCM 10418 / VPI 12708) TaxID=29347 RepID=UPI001D095B7D|nr:extracellular solute-binding protein [[Clostridium] scindens]MCB6285118.1 extracellular solute-binding protein [[Clostridium] scindens]MCB7191303.1 extracellular solute-binding protein [[Clostridium] scindens]MCB7284485.1 extracellular solute-binding protein [[Clostridium] scindens]MCQ5289028.1 extracellular solute-binding protein [[Clostridium] scindens]
MKKKIVSVLLCVAMVATMAVGCGGKKTDGDSGSSKGGDKLVYWAMWSEDEPQAKVIKDAIAKYTEDTGVKVDVQFKGRNGQREGLQPALDAKQNIDLFDEDVNRVNGTWGKYLMDLEDMAKDYEAEHGNETLFKIARNAYGQTHDGDDTLHTIPYQPSIFGFFYNKTLFDKAGVEGVPTTWEEMDAACAKLKEAGITPITADDAYMTSFIGMHLARYIGQDGVKSLVTGEASNDGTVTWDDPKVLAAAESFADFADKGYFSKNIATNKYPAGQNQEFAPGEAAIVICGSWLPNEAKESVADDLEWGYFNYPSVPDGTDDSTANNIANQVFAINKDSKMADEAFELITYITTGEFDKKMTEEALCIPTDKANSDAWPTELAGVKEGFDATTTYYDWAAGVESNNDLTPVLQQNTLDLAAGKIDAAGFIKAMTKAAGQ